MFCRKCGNEIPEGAIFCVKCGTRINDDNIESYRKSNMGVWIALTACITAAVVLLIVIAAIIIRGNQREDYEIVHELVEIPETREEEEAIKGETEEASEADQPEITSDEETAQNEKMDTSERPGFIPLNTHSKITDVEKVVNDIDMVCGLVDSGKYDGIGPNNYYRVWQEDGGYIDRLIKTGLGTGNDSELDSLMEKYGYIVYQILFYYDNEASGMDAISDGPIKIVADIDGRNYQYYFFFNNLIRRVAPEATTDNPETNEFLQELYRIGFEKRWDYNDSNRVSTDNNTENNTETNTALYKIVVSAYDNFVNLRTGPDTAFEILTPIYNGVVLEIQDAVETEKGWWMKTTFQGKTGWIAASQVTILQE